MIPYLLAALGGYLIGESQKKDSAEEPQMAKGGLTDEIKLYYHKTSGGAEYLCSSKVKGTKGEGSFDSKYTVRIDGAKKHGGELYIKDEIGREEIKLYYHKTSGGAEYLMSSSVEGTDEGSFDSEFIVRIDGAKNKGGELQVGKIKMPMVYAKGGSVETGAASMKIKLKDGIISVYHSDGSKLLSWKAKKGDWDKIWDRFNYLGHQMAKGGELGAAEIKVELKNGNINIFHSDGRKLYGWKANSGDWDEIWDRLYELSGKEMADGGMMYAKGGKVKKKWIQDALGGDEGSLRRTAKRKGLLKGDENLSMTDLKKLQKMGGKTAKRAHLAETLRKFDDGGMTDYYEDLRVYVQGVGTIYKGNSLSEATDVFDEYYANNPHAEMVMVDEKYGDEIKWANTSSTDDNDD